MKPAGFDLVLAISTAEKAIENVNIAPVLKLLTDKI